MLALLEPPRKGSFHMKCFRHRIGVHAKIYFDLDLDTSTPSLAELVEAVVASLSAVTDDDGAFELAHLAGGRVFPAWNSVDRELEPGEALDPAKIEVRDVTKIDRPN